MDPSLDRLHDSTERSFDEIENVALVIKVVGPDQRHIGILYKNPDELDASVWVLDLQRHHILGSKVARAASWPRWTTPSIEPDVAYVLAKVCAQIAVKHAQPKRGIKYALRYAGGQFDRETGIFANEGGLGLTCATFVMAVFASHGIDLLRWAEWPEREDDRAWQQRIVAWLREDGAHEEHVHAVNEEAIRGCARYRPEEVAAAGAAPALPIGFADAERVGRQIVQKLHGPAPGGA